MAMVLVGPLEPAKHFFSPFLALIIEQSFAARSDT
jgi:hypothetical protein